MTVTVSIADARRVQRDLKLTDVHVAYVCDDGFVLAHTDAERALRAGLTLELCRYHYWLGQLENPRWAPYLWEFPAPGWYALHGFTHAEGLAL